jgi:hypothetical protein
MMFGEFSFCRKLDQINDVLVSFLAFIMQENYLFESTGKKPLFRQEADNVKESKYI